LQPHSPDGEPPRPVPDDPLSAAAGPFARDNGQAGGLIRLSGRIPAGGDTQSIILSPGQRPRPADPGKAGCSHTPGPAITGLVAPPDRKAPSEPLTSHRASHGPPCPLPPNMIRSWAGVSRTPCGRRLRRPGPRPGSMTRPSDRRTRQLPRGQGGDQARPTPRKARAASTAPDHLHHRPIQVGRECALTPVES
jgi:hypothetical protein